MRNFLLFTILILFLFNVNAQNWWNSGVKGEGPRVEQKLELKSFNGIKLTLAADVYLTKGNTQSVSISAQQNIIDLIKTEVKDGIWKITTEENIRDHSPIKVYITVPNMNYVGLSGSGDIHTEGTFDESEEVTVTVSGSGNIRFNTIAKSIDASVSGSGDIELAGSAQNTSISISGSGDIDAYNFQSNSCEVRVSGSGDVKVHTTDELNVRVSGSGDVYYRGSPNLNSRISGSGNLHGSKG
jgi:hypothetical protein